jgi:hypothetical protein
MLEYGVVSRSVSSEAAKSELQRRPTTNVYKDVLEKHVLAQL